MKNKILINTLFILLALFVASCGGTEEVVTEQGEETGEADASTEVIPGPTNITFWYAIGGTRGELLQEMIDEFNATNSDEITVEATYTGNYPNTAFKIVASLESGDLPNGGLIPVAPLYTCREGNYLIEENINGPEGINMDDYWPVLWDYNTFEDHICSLPFNNSTMVMYYNKDLMEAAGLDPESPPQTWDELYEQGKAIVDNGAMGVDVKGTDWWLKSLILQNGGQIMNEDTTAPAFASEEGYGALEYWKRLVDDGVMPLAQHASSRDLFIAGQIGFWMSSTGNVSRIQDGAQFEWGTAFLPGNVAQGGTIGGASLVMFPDNATNELATWRFLKWLISPENSVTFAANTGYVPISKEAAEADEIQELYANEPVYKAGFEQLFVASQYPHFWGIGAMDSYLREAIDKMELGAATPQEALDTAAEKLIENMKN